MDIINGLLTINNNMSSVNFKKAFLEGEISTSRWRKVRTVLFVIKSVNCTVDGFSSDLD